MIRKALAWLLAFIVFFNARILYDLGITESNYLSVLIDWNSALYFVEVFAVGVACVYIVTHFDGN